MGEGYALAVLREAAARHVVMEVLRARDGSGGLIAVDRDGRVAMPFSCEGMYRASMVEHGERMVGIYRASAADLHHTAGSAKARWRRRDSLLDETRLGWNRARRRFRIARTALPTRGIRAGCTGLPPFLENARP